MKSRATRAEQTPPSAGRQRALDPFFIFTYTLLALAAAMQVFLMAWMDFF